MCFYFLYLKGEQWWLLWLSLNLWDTNTSHEYVTVKSELARIYCVFSKVKFGMAKDVQSNRYASWQVRLTNGKKIINH